MRQNRRVFGLWSGSRLVRRFACFTSCDVIRETITSVDIDEWADHVAGIITLVRVRQTRHRSHVCFFAALCHWWLSWRLTLLLSERLVQYGFGADRASKIPYNG